MYYRILSNKDTPHVDVERVNSLIQLSDNQLDGFEPVIEEEKPVGKDGFYIAQDYKIIEGKVHLVYKYEEILEENENMEV